MRLGSKGDHQMPSWRPLTWIIVAVQILFVIWVIAGVGTAADTSDCAGQEYQDACEAGSAIGAGLGFIMILFLWALVDVILGVIWVVTNKNKRTCPACGHNVKKGLLGCPACGFDFAAAARFGGPPAPTMPYPYPDSYPPPGPYPPPSGPPLA